MKNIRETRKSTSAAEHTFHIDEKLKFDNFVETKANKLLVTIAKEISQQYSDGYNPVYISGPNNNDKTHLLHAIANEATIHKSDARIFCATGENFTQYFISALKNNQMIEFNDYFSSLDILFINDFQQLANKDRTQQQLVQFIDNMIDTKKQLVFTGAGFPKEIAGISDKLTDRLNSGLLIKLPQLRTDGKEEISLHTEQDKALPDKALVHKPAAKLKISSNIIKRYNFENFIETKANKVALSAAKAISKHRSYKQPNKHTRLPLLGASGTGKTHLLHAIANAFRKEQADAKVYCAHSNQFIQDCIYAMHNDLMANFNEYFYSLDLLIIDDIDGFSNKQRTPGLFKNIVNVIQNNNKKVVLSSSIPLMEDKLSFVELLPPTFNDRTTLLRHLASSRTLTLCDEAIICIASHTGQCARELEGALNQVQATAQFYDEKTTLDFVKRHLRARQYYLMPQPIQTIK